MDPSFYASQFDTARELITNSTPEAPTGLYSILCALYELDEIKPSAKKEFEKDQLHEKYKPAVICTYLVYHTDKRSDIYNNKIYNRHDAYLTIQDFKKECFKKISIALEQINPQQGIEWRLMTKWTK